MTTQRKVLFSDRKPTTENPIKVAAAFGIPADDFEMQRARNALSEAEREMKTAMAAVGLQPKVAPLLLNRGRHSVTFRGIAS